MEFQRQLSDFKKRAEIAEQEAHEADRRAGQAEGYLKLERAKAAKAIAHEQQPEVVWQTEMMKEIQAQLDDCKKRAESAEVVAKGAVRRAQQAEEHLRVERANAAKAIADALRGENDVRGSDMQQMVLDDRVGQGNDELIIYNTSTHMGSHSKSPPIWQARFEGVNMDDSDSDNQAYSESPATRTTKSEPHVGYRRF